MAKCKFCKQPATQRFGLNYFCNPDCAYNHARAIQAKKAIKDASEQRKRDRMRLAKLKKPHEHASKAQTLFNKMRRLECLLWFKEKNLEPVCISCQKPLGGDVWACGHYKTRGARKDLAFERLNTHLQHNFSCNKNKSGDVEGQKIGYAMIYGAEDAARILTDLEVRREIPKRTPEDWQAMKKEFSAEIRRLEKLINKA
jgi:hypothetical protein